MTNTILVPDHCALVEERAAEPTVQHTPSGFSDRFALSFTKLLRFTADTFFAKRYGHRAIVLETVAAVPGMVGKLDALRIERLEEMLEMQGRISADSYDAFSIRPAFAEATKEVR